ncbi:hypothetical protein SNEBB_006301 [Seison nebaliae]|nr:hypothetical protein SNEBB_006301 [Seison nebaliae]
MTKCTLIFLFFLNIFIFKNVEGLGEYPFMDRERTDRYNYYRDIDDTFQIATKGIFPLYKSTEVLNCAISTHLMTDDPLVIAKITGQFNNFCFRSSLSTMQVGGCVRTNKQGKAEVFIVYRGWLDIKPYATHLKVVDKKDTLYTIESKNCELDPSHHIVRCYLVVQVTDGLKELIDKLGNYCKSMVNENEDPDLNAIPGIINSYATIFTYVTECAMHHLTNQLNIINEHETLNNCRIVCVNYKIQYRLLEGWYVESKEDTETIGNDEAEIEGIDIIKKYLDSLASTLTLRKKVDKKSVTRVVPLTLLKQLLTLPELFTIDEHFEINELPSTNFIESELLWPKSLNDYSYT